MKGRCTKIKGLCLIVSYCFSHRKAGLGDSQSGALTLFLTVWLHPLWASSELTPF